jgi:hypothetical protein
MKLFRRHISYLLNCSSNMAILALPRARLLWGHTPRVRSLRYNRRGLATASADSRYASSLRSGYFLLTVLLFAGLMMS